jgi:hypothetical protein
MVSRVSYAESLLRRCLIQVGQYVTRRWRRRVVWERRGITQRRWRRRKRVDVRREGGTGLGVDQSGNPCLDTIEPVPQIQPCDVGFEKYLHFLSRGT